MSTKNELLAKIEVVETKYNKSVSDTNLALNATPVLYYKYEDTDWDFDSDEICLQRKFICITETGPELYDEHEAYYECRGWSFQSKELFYEEDTLVIDIKINIIEELDSYELGQNIPKKEFDIAWKIYKDSIRNMKKS